VVFDLTTKRIFVKRVQCTTPLIYYSEQTDQFLHSTHSYKKPFCLKVMTAELNKLITDS